ncbi:MAG: hypothetical protein KKH99_14675, partial [Proteobacteria bacterium]|nr:hypothetical protein [Pseudomonadota bacterium]
SETRNITIDITGPTATLDRPLSFENITGTSSYTINASVSDPGINNISMVTFEYRQNATDTWTFACNDDRGPTYDCEWNLIGLPDGNNYQVRAWANDTLGNNGSYSTHTSITIDNNPPNITLLLPPNENVDADGNVTLTYSVNDAAAGVANCTFIWNGEEDQINPGPILEDQELQFEKYNLVNGDYNWTINCTDVFGQIGTATNGPRNITVDIRYTMNVKVNSSKIQYEIGNQAGEPINISTNTTDFYNNPLNTLTKTDIILGNTTQPWWNTSWERRQPIYLTETSGQDRTNINIEVSVTGLSGYISSCTNEIRVASVDLEPVTVNIIEGDDSTYCTIVFQGDVSANANNEELYFVYFNNSNAPNPSYPALTGKYYNEFLDDFNTGTYPDTSKWDNPGNEWDINTQRAHTVRTNGYKLLSTLDNLINLSNYDSANLTFDWEVDASGLESDDCLKLDLYSGASWTNEVWKKCDDTIPTSGTQEITLSSIYLISTFRLRYGAATDANGEDMWIDNVNVTAYKLTDFNISGNTGLTQQHKSRQEDNTGEDGIIDFKFNSYSYLLSNYSAVSLASKSLYANTSNHVMFETIPDQTPPNITLNSPPDNGSSNSSVTFEYYVNDTTSTVLNCTLYLDGEEEDNETLIQEGPVQYFEPRIPSAGWHNWSVNCTDYYGNIGASEEWQIWIKPPDFRIISANITFNNTSPKEGESIRINATIYNVGGSDATNVTMQFWVGDPNTTGYQINSNFTANISDPTGDHSNASINVTWTVTGPGPFDIYVVADPPTETNGTILEINETNNKAYKTLHVPAYNYFYGSVQNNMYLSNIDNDDLYYYLNITQIS